ncbi:division/cell wall cluster transcriptional repressor MraZ [Sphingomonas sp. AR_OL41]|uniref:division/cell wall cluster transcriptional repressor MraZ n=1 Tax=Sphingomonas sp. AR_OL41 TaxID=3042729 RepID=UPI0024804518|nr:division/cell wall cluster transcriptional repressor MraZ [Sphingomonas sp. AR_OL41]MDH7974984.1 division/cell wall cluster transcriptional repressor MraZ [Sphingomonas sp. AR_OL41]
MDELFIGSAICKVSRRGDLMLPTSFRKTARVRSATPDIRLFVDMDEQAGCLRLFDRAYINQIYCRAELAAEQAAQGPLVRDAARRRLLAFAAPVELQPNGQLTLPAVARARLKIRDRALLVATGALFEIWDVAYLLEWGSDDLVKLANLHLNPILDDGADHEACVPPARSPRGGTRGGQPRLPVQSLSPLPPRHGPIEPASLQ